MLTRTRTRAGALLTSLVLLAPAVQCGVGTPMAEADTTATIKRFMAEFATAQRTTRGKGVTVAILGTGVSRTGSLKDVVGHEHDLVRTPNAVKLTGSVAASLLAGRGAARDGLPGLRGLAPAVGIMSVRIRPERGEPGYYRFYDQGGGPDVAAKGIRYATDHGADVILVDQNIPVMQAFDVAGAVAYANSKNVVVVAGNRLWGKPGDGMQYGSYPATVAGVIGVGDVDAQGRPSGSWSGRDTAVLVAAPGVRAGFERTELGPVWGPLAAATSVSAVAAMIRSEFPDLPPRLVADAIARSAHHPKGGYDTEVGFGVVNPAEALKEARRLQDAPPAMVARTGTVADRTHFGGAVPDRIQAAPPDVAWLARFGGLAAAGLAALVLSVIIAVRSRRRNPVASASGPADPADAESSDA